MSIADVSFDQYWQFHFALICKCLGAVENGARCLKPPIFFSKEYYWNDQFVFYSSAFGKQLDLKDSSCKMSSPGGQMLHADQRSPENNGIHCDPKNPG